MTKLSDSPISRKGLQRSTTCLFDKRIFPLHSARAILSAFRVNVATILRALLACTNMGHGSETAEFLRHPARRLGRALWFSVFCLALPILANVCLAQLNHIEKAANLLNQGQMDQAETEARQALKNPSTRPLALDRKSTRLNSSHTVISYAVFCLKKKKKGRPLTQSGAPGPPGRAWLAVSTQRSPSVTAVSAWSSLLVVLAHFAAPAAPLLPQVTL